MKIAICFYGLLYGGFTNHEPMVKNKDFRHCWPNIKKYVVDPFIAGGHEVDILVSSYKINDEDVEKQFFDMVKPAKIVYSDFNNSNTFTSKYASFENLKEPYEHDFVILTRFDLHWNKVLFNENIDYTKFNYLFPENDSFIQNEYKQFGFTCDNVYMWPIDMTPTVSKAMMETYRFPRSFSPDTHALKFKMIQHIGEQQTHAISNSPDFSHLNEFYTICKENLHIHDHNLVHPEVKERFNYV